MRSLSHQEALGGDFVGGMNKGVLSEGETKRNSGKTDINLHRAPPRKGPVEGEVPFVTGGQARGPGSTLGPTRGRDIPWVGPSVDPSHEPTAGPDHTRLERSGLLLWPGPCVLRALSSCSCSIGLRPGPAPGGGRGHPDPGDNTAARPAPPPASPGRQSPHCHPHGPCFKD
ncbi:translation initiation factor IF-2-like [Pipistrellus kuhlii]|uniref:translation initiation factor IF-2-like n=1 Tax=Pipistrellus kuhlii TaxID=59472 RepID=UPI001E2725C0|nr:translation initiation factor IF-2-like [Pipistrellus kuhlii]